MKLLFKIGLICQKFYIGPFIFFDCLILIILEKYSALNLSVQFENLNFIILI